MYNNMPSQKMRRSGLNWFQKILLFIMTLLGIACMTAAILLYFGYPIPGVKLPAFLGFLEPSPTAIPTPGPTATITLTDTSTPYMSPTFTGTPTRTDTLIPTRTKAPTWTLLPMFITPSVTPYGTPPPPTRTPARTATATPKH
ncbi:MAG TPA: hypothetical protein VMT91_07970 [Anaerolineales bacterium]|nr:hypothetical protein [Anaerolineales bacterium]